MDFPINNKYQAWIHALRLRTLPLALSSILMGSFIAVKHGAFRPEVFLLAALTTILLQILSNLANDYGDTAHGADHEGRKGPVRSVQSGWISKKEMKTAIIVFSILSFISGILLLYLALQGLMVFLLFLLLGILAIIAAITYTSGSRPYGYVGLGDFSVFLFFGIIGVSGTYFLHTLAFSPSTLLPAISVGCFSTAVLNINNIRDIESDQLAGKKSIPVRIGRKKAITYNWILIVTGNVCILLFILFEKAVGGLFMLMVLPLMIKVGQGVDSSADPVALDPYLKKMAISTLLWVLTFGLGWILV
ncbi:1,4-dihydroxy-2-naphthoate polyprenyltransferase [Negadavirga shengliensis]|uniref:1,4-dihydroxy-2-naphthoate octaprenyltransferase n=1 Tax=Negadavirga shengliensis TaxID=1389218 RepID=A0ABV9T679_9BACT